MAHIPYGYRIRNGLAEIDPEQSEKVRKLYEDYISGLSVRGAKESAGIPVAVSTVNKILKNPVYLGDDYYPAIITQDAFDASVRIHEERFAALGSHRAIKPMRAEPVETAFRIKPLPNGPEGMTAAEIVGAVYSCITGNPSGSAEMNPKDRARVRKWMKQTREERV